jgi:ribonuclease BN (tRNA processing enzyme)
MKYLIKAISTNTKDMKTGLVIIIDDCQYLFNAPDGLQRVALFQKLSFHKSKYIFISSLSPNHFSGFPGFYMSAREGLRTQEGQPLGLGFYMTVLGP